MIDRRFLLATVAGLFGFASLRFFKTLPAQAAETFEIEKTDAQWRAQLTPQQYQILRKQGTESPWSSPLLKSIARGLLPAPAATCRCSPPKPSSTAAPAGRASISRCKTPSAPPKTAPWACCVPRCIAADAVAISGTSLTMGQNPLVYATAWTAMLWCSIRPTRPQASVIYCVRAQSNGMHSRGAAASACSYRRIAAASASFRPAELPMR